MSEPGWTPSELPLERELSRNTIPGVRDTIPHGRGIANRNISLTYIYPKRGHVLMKVGRAKVLRRCSRQPARPVLQCVHAQLAATPSHAGRSRLRPARMD